MYDDEEIDRDLFMLGEPLHTISKEYLSHIDEDFSQEGFFMMLAMVPNLVMLSLDSILNQVAVFY